MKTHRENPDSEEMQISTKQTAREVFAAKMMATPCPLCEGDGELSVGKCPTCEGSGSVYYVDEIVTDKGTKWQRSTEMTYEGECPTCNGEGVINDDDN